MVDFAKRAADHNYRLDPIIRSLLDTDFYKLLMMQFVWELYPSVHVTWRVKCRTSGVKLEDFLVTEELRAQLAHAQTLRFMPNELVWLRGQTFYGEQGIFKPGFINALRTFQLPDFKIIPGDGTEDTQVEFSGPWWRSMAWEVPGLAIISELRSRWMLRDFTPGQLDVTYAKAKVRLHDKLQRVAYWRYQQEQYKDSKHESLKYPDLNITDFGTRRRHGFLWQEYCVLACRDILGAAFTGTSNVYLAYKHGLEPRGTNAHELPMVFAALARAAAPEDSAALVASQYGFLHQWGVYYPPALRMLLPDAYGTTQFLANAPNEFADWRGARPDSKEPYAAAREFIAWWQHKGLTPEEIASKLLIFADGMDILLDSRSGPGLGDTSRNSPDIIMLHEAFSRIVQVGFGLGTHLTNDFWGAAPPPLTYNNTYLKALSLVCKVYSVNGTPAVKLSDNYAKATGDPAEVEHYRSVFGTAGMEEVPVVV